MFSKPLVWALSVGLAASQAFALSIADYDPSINNRFSSGFPTAPSGNPHPDFVGAGLDFSGVAWAYGTGLSGGTKRMQNVTLLTPLHVIQASHFTSRPGTPYLFLGTDNVLHENAITKSAPISASVTNDITVGTLESAFHSEQTITPFRILETRTNTYEGLPLLIYGSQINSQGARIAPAIGTFRSGALSFWASSRSGGAQAWESGDSGSPALVVYTAPDGSRSLTFAGAAWYPTAFSTLQPLSSGYNPVAGINNLTKADGYAIKWTIYENPINSSASAPTWTGNGSSSVFDPANWNTLQAPSGNSVVFTSSVPTNSPSSLLIEENAILRGALFRGDSSFKFSGNGTLTLGQVGLRNESSKIQTFSVNIKLTDSQNWEAVHGGLVFSGNIDTTSSAHLLAIGGTANTQLDGVLSGSGSLAKEGQGQLLINTAATYTGKTWIHEGFLGLGVNQALPTTTEVIFDAANHAVLDLQGHTLSIMGLRSTFDGTGDVNLNGGSLTVNTTSTNSHYHGLIQGVGDFTKTGSGLLALYGENMQAGTLRIEGGVLRAASQSALSPSARIVIAGGVLELGASNFLANLGDGPGDLRFSGTGGFSAHGGARSVILDQGADLIWGQEGFLSGSQGLLFGSTVATATVDFQNSLILGSSGSGMRNLLATGLGGQLSGNLSDGSGKWGVNKYNGGLLIFAGNNSYKGDTVIHGGALRMASEGALSQSSNLGLSGGVLELGFSDLQMALGAGPGQLRFLADGGFSAVGIERHVALDGGVELSWGEGHFLREGNRLLLSSAYADATVIFENSLNLGTTGSASRIINVANGSAPVDAHLNGNITQAGGIFGLTKEGAGTLELSGVNSYSGPTLIQGGALRVSSITALPASEIVLNGGVLEMAFGDHFTSEVTFSGSGGFSAAGGDRRVILNGGNLLTWGSNTFIASGKTFILSSTGADSTLTFENGISLGASGGGSRTIQVDDGSAEVDALLSGNITQTGGTFGITKTGNGTLELTGTNTYTGNTTIHAGALRLGSTGALPSNSMLVLNGGVIELGAGNFSGTIGTTVSFGSRGGFSAAGANRQVTLNGGAAIMWSSSSAISSSTTLLLSSPGSDATITFANPLILSGGPKMRTVEVADGSAAVDARISGIISERDGNYGIIKTGDGTLELTGANTYRGLTQVDAGTLLIVGDQSGATGNIVVASGSFLGGSGIIGGATTIQEGGTLDLGDLPMHLRVNDSLLLSSGSTLRITLDQESFSRLTGVKQIDLNGAWLALNLTDNFVASAVVGSEFRFISGTNIQGHFVQGNNISIACGELSYRFDILYDEQTVSLLLEEISPIPEPNAIILLLGVAILSSGRHFKDRFLALYLS